MQRAIFINNIDGYSTFENYEIIFCNNNHKYYYVS